MLSRTGKRLLVVQAGADEPLITRTQNRKSADQVAIIEAKVRMSRFGQSIGQTHEQVLPLVHELIRDLDLQEQCGGIDLVGRTRFFVLPRLLQIGALAGTVERDFTLLAATLRANPPVDSGTESFLLADLADGAAQSCLLTTIMTDRQRETPSTSNKTIENSGDATQKVLCVSVLR